MSSALELQRGLCMQHRKGFCETTRACGGRRVCGAPASAYAVPHHTALWSFPHVAAFERRQTPVRSHAAALEDFRYTCGLTDIFSRAWGGGGRASPYGATVDILRAIVPRSSGALDSSARSTSQTHTRAPAPKRPKPSSPLAGRSGKAARLELAGSDGGAGIVDDNHAGDSVYVPSPAPAHRPRAPVFPVRKRARSMSGSCSGTRTETTVAPPMQGPDTSTHDAAVTVTVATASFDTSAAAPPPQPPPALLVTAPVHACRWLPHAVVDGRDMAAPVDSTLAATPGETTPRNASPLEGAGSLAAAPPLLHLRKYKYKYKYKIYL
jgi:hypothetical protein